MPWSGGASGGGTVTPSTLAGYEIGYDAITATVTVTSTTEVTPTTVVAGSSHTFDGALVLAEFFSPLIVNPNDASTVITLMESTTEITRFGAVNALTGLQPGQAFYAAFRFTPSAGAHTYTAASWISGGASASVVAGTGSGAAYPPAFLRFTKV